MNYGNLVNEIRLYLSMQGTEMMHMIKSFLNESIIDFVRIYEWEKSKVAEIITLDGSGSYDLSAVLTNPFEGEIGLIDSSGAEMQKFDYKMYATLDDKTGYYSIFGNTLYVGGTTGDLTFMYISPGNPYPLVNDTDENLITLYYWQIIKKMTASYMLKYISDPQAAEEDKMIAFKINSLRSMENRTRKQGKFSHVHRA